MRQGDCVWSDIPGTLILLKAIHENIVDSPRLTFFPGNHSALVASDLKQILL